jgi:UDP-GlcNAc:undecaprenyl-phosphate/decaprenyl-phosphate GlcNAc-1-phosphate transferase
VHALPSLVALAAAVALTPAILRHLRVGGFVRENYRGVALPFPAGIAIVAAGVLSLGVCVAVERIAHVDLFGLTGWINLEYPLGVALLGLVDDLLSGPPERTRGWRGHARTVLGGDFSTGALKAVGSLALALYVLSGTGPSTGDYLLAVALLVLTTNLFNLLDLRPGRSVKAFTLLGTGLALGAWSRFDGAFVPLWLVGPLAAPILVVGFHDLNERTMLGDTGSNLVGAVAGLWLIYALGTTGQLVALAIVLALTLYGEFRSISATIERIPLLRWIDSLGRIETHA